MTITGLKNLRAKLTKKIPAQAKLRAAQALAESADELIAMQKSLAPKKSGKLRDSIVATYGGQDAPRYAAFRQRKQGKSKNSKIIPPDDLGVVITAGNNGVRYAHLVEFGTAPHINGGKFAGSKHPGSTAKPFFYPPYRALRKRIKSRVGRAIRKGIKEGSE